MAAGNTREEAICVGLFEVMERWAAAEVFYKRLCPPTIASSFLKNFENEMKIIRQIEAANYELTVKDFSVKLGLPVVGVVVLDKFSDSYRLSVGCDSSFQVALSRALTELYQGIQSEEYMKSVLHSVPSEELDIFIRDNDNTLIARGEEFRHYLENGTGRFPLSLFEDKPDYKFDESVYEPQDSYSEEIKIWVEKIRQMGHDVYVRDVSFLGFPSYYVYIPNISVVGSRRADFPGEYDFTLQRDLDKAIKILCTIEKIDKENIYKAASTLSRMSANLLFADVFALEFNNDSEMNHIPISFLEAGLWFSIGEFKKSLKAFDKFLTIASDDEDYWLGFNYYLAIRKWIECKVRGLNNDLTYKELLEYGFKKDITERVAEDLGSPDQVFYNLRLPKCPNCEACSLKGECWTRGRLNLASKVFTSYIKANVNQNDLSDIISVSR